MSDTLFWFYYILSWVAPVGIFVWATCSIVATIKKFRSKKTTLVNVVGNTIEASVIAVFISFMSLSMIGGMANPRHPYKQFDDDLFPHAPCYTHAYWIADTQTLVLNDIAPDAFDDDILNPVVDATFLFQEAPFFMEVIAGGIRPFDKETADKFRLTPFERDEWQINPFERRDDDRRFRIWNKTIQAVPDNQKQAFEEDAIRLLKQYLFTTNKPSTQEARAYLRNGLKDRWWIDTLDLVPKTNNWQP